MHQLLIGYIADCVTEFILRYMNGPTVELICHYITEEFSILWYAISRMTHKHRCENLKTNNYKISDKIIKWNIL
jgi:hypothetical protein